MSSHSRLTKNLDRVMEDLGMRPDEKMVAKAADGGVPGPRRAAARHAASRMTNLQIVETDGVLTLLDRPAFSLPNRRRGPIGISRIRGDVVAERPMEVLPYNQLTKQIERLDAKLTPERGLREWKDGKIIGTGNDIRPVGAKKKILLFVHGTFSESEAFFRQIDRRGFHEGKSFLSWAGQTYDQILTFDHPTLSVSPMLNAHALANHLGPCGADIDVICHSRGGLVTRWWTEAFDRGRGNRRVAFVGSPLHGTGLASPDNIRNSLNLAANLGSVLTKTSMAVPVLQFATGMFQIVTSVLRVAGKTPLADTVVSLVPGLAAQSRVGNNHELASLRREINGAQRDRYFFVISDFKSDKPSWQFWKHFQKGKIKNLLLDVGTDYVFTGKNDLVVDTPSMTDLFDGAKISREHIHDFGSQDDVTHTNYFERAETLDFIRQSFAIPTSGTRTRRRRKRTEAQSELVSLEG